MKIWLQFLTFFLSVAIHLPVYSQDKPIPDVSDEMKRMMQGKQTLDGIKPNVDVSGILEKNQKETEFLNTPNYKDSMALDELIKDCGDLQKDAENTCDAAESDPLNVLKTTIPAMANAIGGALICNRFGQIMVASSIALASFKTSCQKAYNRCADKCDETFDAAQAEAKRCLLESYAATHPYTCGSVNQYVIDEIRSNRRQCLAKDKNVASAAQMIAQGAAAFMQMSQCKKESLAVAGELCKTDPTSAYCVQLNMNVDCGDPKNAANLVCKCKANPNSVECAAGTNGGFTASVQPKIGSSGGATTDGSGLSGLDSGGNIDGINDAAYGDVKPSDRAALSPNSGGGGAGGGGFGNANPNNGDGGGGGAGGGPGQDPNILKGYYGGGGGAPGSGPGGRGGSGDPSGRGGGYGSGASAKGGLDPNMLKDSLARRRFPSGVIHPDGICGQHCNIFESMNGRYLNLKPSLISK